MQSRSVNAYVCKSLVRSQCYRQPHPELDQPADLAKPRERDLEKKSELQNDKAANTQFRPSFQYASPFFLSLQIFQIFFLQFTERTAVFIKAYANSFLRR